MHSSHAIRLGLVLTGLCALGVASSRPASAQTFQYTLSGVTFADGAIATGSFSYNFTTNTFGAFDVTTTNGLTDGLLGTHYLPPTGTATAVSNFAFEFFSGRNELVLNTFGADNASGTLLLQPGSIPQGGGLMASGEFATPATGGSTSARVISAGSLVATGAPVPEASTTVSFGLLLALGMGGLVLAAKRRKASTSF